MNDPFVCIVIPYVCWNELVSESVEGCLALDYSHFEICLVTSDGSGAPKEIQENSRIRIIETTELSISAKRNRAMEKSPKTDLFAFIDSDAYPDKAWLRNTLPIFQSKPDLWAIGGPEIPPRCPTAKQQSVVNALKSFLVSGPKAFMKTRSKSDYVEDLHTCNMIVRKEAADKVGGFDPIMLVGEDSAFCQQILMLGGKIYFSSDVTVFHHSRPLFLPYIKQRITTGFGIPLLVKRYGQSMKLGRKLSRFAPSAALLYFAFGWLVIFVHPLLLGIWLAGVAIYLATVLLEAVRYSKQPSEIFLTIIALIIGNLGPGIGALLALSGGKLQIQKFYVNSEGRRTSRK